MPEIQSDISNSIHSLFLCIDTFFGNDVVTLNTHMLERYFDIFRDFLHLSSYDKFLTGEELYVYGSNLIKKTECQKVYFLTKDPFLLVTK